MKSVYACSCNPTAISLKAGCELFLRYTTRTSAIENEDFATAKARIIEVSPSPGNMPVRSDIDSTFATRLDCCVIHAQKIC